MGEENRLAKAIEALAAEHRSANLIKVLELRAYCEANGISLEFGNAEGSLLSRLGAYEDGNGLHFVKEDDQ